MPFRFDLFVQRMKRRRSAEKPKLSLVEKAKDAPLAPEAKPEHADPARATLRRKSRA